MDKLKKLFEAWMDFMYEEPEWDEGWSRIDLEDAFNAGYKKGKDESDS